jgi:group I intron endonuclease
MNGGVYIITIGPKYRYYGSTKSFANRYTQHLTDLKAGRHHNAFMQRAYNKHGHLNFAKVLTCSRLYASRFEQFFLDLDFDAPGNMNLSPYSVGGCGRTLSDGHKQKIAEAITGIKRSQETRDKLRYKRSPETIEKMRAFQSNRPAETHEKIRQTLMGHEVPDEVRKKISESLKGRKQSAESQRKRSESLKKSWAARKAAV